MQHSVIRRSLMVSVAFAIGHLFHYALMFSANRILDPGAFGRFYAAISLLNVMLTPATVLSFMLAKHFAGVFSAAGIAALSSELKMLMHRHGTAGLILVVLSAVGLMFVGFLLGADAFLLLLLVPGVALSIYLFEMARAALQGMLDFYAYSAAWIIWRAGQYALAVAALSFAGAAWAGMAAILIATIAATLVLLRVIYARAHAAPAAFEGVSWAPFRVTAAVTFGLQYGIFVLISNVDVLLAYVVLSNEELGAYSASSFLPKAIVTATLPVTQVMLPVMSASSEQQPRRLTALLKALGVTAFISTAGVVVLVLGADLACNDRFGIRFCAPWLLGVLALGAIPLSLSRVLMVAGLALDSDRRIIVPAAVVIGFAVAASVWAASPSTLAVIYTGFCWLFAFAYALVTSYDRQKARNTVAAESAGRDNPSAS
jgi:O-antigen/teichoic acid export membrane protein